MADLFSSRAEAVSTHLWVAGQGTGTGGPAGLTFLFLQQAGEFLALFRGENLLDTAAAFAEHGAVILPEIVEYGFDLIGLGGRRAGRAHAVCRDHEPGHRPARRPLVPGPV